MKKKVWSLKLCLLLLIVTCFAVPVYGDLQDEKDKKEEMEAELKDTEAYLESLEVLKSDNEAYISA